MSGTGELWKRLRIDRGADRHSMVLGRVRECSGVHVNMALDIWNAVRKYAEATGEPSLSYIARKLLRERLTELGT